MIFWLLAALSFAQGIHAHGDTAPPSPGETQSLLTLANRPLSLRAGIGRAHDRVSTRSMQAQAYYDQGLAYLHSYVWLEAARSFNQALALDPNLAIAHAQLSIAYTELNASDAAHAALQRATVLAPRASEHDRRHIEARALQMSAEEAGRDAARLTGYRAALDKDVAMFPTDVEFWLLRGLAESPDPAERGQGGVVGSIRFYQKALALAPDHFAAHHYLTHAYENTGRSSEALTEGAIYARMAPNVPHARHMYGHSLRRMGRIQDAITEFSAADALGIDYLESENIPVEYDWHYQHNLDLLATSHQYLGQMRKAEAFFRKSFSIPSSLVVQEFNKREWPVFLLARGRVKEALEAAGAMAAHRSPIVSAAGHVMIGEAHLALAEYQAAADEANTALRLMRNAPMGAGLVADSLQVLQGEFLLRTGQRSKARPMLEDVARKLRVAPGPDAWGQALFTLEAIARAAREVGEWDFAGWAARQMLEHDPNYGGSHFALGLVAEREGDLANARREFELAKGLWKEADPNVLELLTIKKH
jgi:tetratricopeptide (TPR) repeat protein